MSETIYIDMEQSYFHNRAGAFFIVDNNGKPCEIVYTGKTYLPMSACYKKEKVYQILADEFDVRFIFEDNIPRFNFYPIPRLEIFAADSIGGCFGAIKNPVAFEEDDSPIYYISSDKPIYIAPNLKEFIQLIVFCADWRKSIASSYNKSGNIIAKDYLIDTLKLKENVHNREGDINKNKDLQIYNSFEEANKHIEFYDISKLKLEPQH